MSIGFSSTLLTVLLVAYNIQAKALRRFTLDYILTNTWIRLLFTLFFYIVLSLSISFAVGDSPMNKGVVTRLYIDHISVILFLLLIFPLLFLSLNESRSLQSIRNLARKIDKDVAQAVVGSKHADADLEDIERNPLLVLKDIALTAVAERDWVIPQTVIKTVTDQLLKESEDLECGLPVDDAFEAWRFLYSRLKREAIGSDDLITARAIVDAEFKVTATAIKRKGFSAFWGPYECILFDFFKLAIKQDKLAEMRSYFLTTGIDYINLHLSSWNYSDEEVPTMYYYNENREADRNHDITDLQTYWYFIRQKLISEFLEMVQFAVLKNDKVVAENFHFNTERLAGIIVKNTKLTKYQKKELLRELDRLFRNTSTVAIHNGFANESYMMHGLHIALYYRDSRDFGQDMLYLWSNNIKTNTLNGKLSRWEIKDFFDIARDATVKNDLDEKSKIEILDTVFGRVLKVYSSENIAKGIRKEIASGIRWIRRLQIDYKIPQDYMAAYDEDVNKILDTHREEDYFKED